jgi:hypothetical protein
MSMARDTCPAMLLMTSSPALIPACHRQAGEFLHAKLTAPCRSTPQASNGT